MVGAPYGYHYFAGGVAHCLSRREKRNGSSRRTTMISDDRDGLFVGGRKERERKREGVSVSGLETVRFGGWMAESTGQDSTAPDRTAPDRTKPHQP